MAHCVPVAFTEVAVDAVDPDQLGDPGRVPNLLRPVELQPAAPQGMPSEHFVVRGAHLDALDALELHDADPVIVFAFAKVERNECPQPRYQHGHGSTRVPLHHRPGIQPAVTAVAALRVHRRRAAGFPVDEYVPVAGWDVSTEETNLGYIRRTIKPARGSKEVRKIQAPLVDNLHARLVTTRPVRIGEADIPAGAKLLLGAGCLQSGPDPVRRPGPLRRDQKARRAAHLLRSRHPLLPRRPARPDGTADRARAADPARPDLDLLPNQKS
jgi:hypothetical protein